jgi:hypothetical protein
MLGLNRAMVRTQNPALNERCYPMHPAMDTWAGTSEPSMTVR